MNIETIFYYITYLILYSFAGWILESVYKSICEKKFVNSGFLTGPFCPIYGFGAIIMLLCLSFLKDNPILLFIVAFFILSIWEYIVGLLLEKIFRTKYWDYSNLKFNIHGRVCLKNSIYWGTLGVIFICLIHPFVDFFIKQIPFNILIYSDVIIGIAIIIDLIFNAKSIVNWETAIEKLNELTEKIKELTEKTKIKTVKIEKNGVENVEKMIKEMKKSQAKLKIRMYKQAVRLKNAFPTMKSENITKFLNQKIDLKNLKDIVNNKDKE